MTPVFDLTNGRFTSIIESSQDQSTRILTLLSVSSLLAAKAMLPPRYRFQWSLNEATTTQEVR